MDLVGALLRKRGIEGEVEVGIKWNFVYGLGGRCVGITAVVLGFLIRTGFAIIFAGAEAKSIWIVVARIVYWLGYKRGVDCGGGCCVGIGAGKKVRDRALGGIDSRIGGRGVVVGV